MIYTSITKPWNSVSKESACNARDLGLIPGSGRSPRDGNGNPLQYSCLENPMDRGASLAIVHGINKSWTWLSDWITTTNWYVISTSITKHRYYQFVVAVKSLSCVQHFVTPWTVACQAFLSITNSRSLLKLTSIESVMPSNHLILCCPLLPCLQSFLA